MMIVKEYALKKNVVKVTLDDDFFYVNVHGKTYYAKYDFNIESTPDHHVDLMVYYMFYGYGENKTAKVIDHHYEYKSLTPSLGTEYVEVDVPSFELGDQIIDSPKLHPEPLFTESGTNKIIMYSGGYDSTCLKVLFPELPSVYLCRDYDPQYKKNQEEAIDHCGAHVVVNNIEKIREEYLGVDRHGFNVGNGYASLIIPYLTKYNANEIICGAVFDDVAFCYDKKVGDVMINLPSNNTSYTNAAHWSKRAGIKVSYPIAGLSEVWTSRIVNNSEYADKASSCHSLSDSNNCGLCYKCLRKLPVINRSNRINSSVIRMGLRKLETKPIKMAVSTVFGMQLLDQFKHLRHIDMSFLEKFNYWYSEVYSDSDIASEVKRKVSELGVDLMSDEEYENILLALEQINKING